MVGGGGGGDGGHLRSDGPRATVAENTRDMTRGLRWGGCTDGRSVGESLVGDRRPEVPPVARYETWSTSPRTSWVCAHASRCLVARTVRFRRTVTFCAVATSVQGHSRVPIAQYASMRSLDASATGRCRVSTPPSPSSTLLRLLPLPLPLPLPLSLSSIPPIHLGFTSACHFSSLLRPHPSPMTRLFPYRP